ncbi:MAG: hypothetical protein ABIW57_07580, partial [Polyangia bacterium]
MDKKSPGPDPSSQAEAHAQDAVALPAAEKGRGSPVPTEVPPTGLDASGARRPMRLTPGSGGYSALLAHSRPKPRTGEVPVPGDASSSAGSGDAPPDPAAVTAPVGARVSDPLETTAVGAETAVPAAAFRDVTTDSGPSRTMVPGAGPAAEASPRDDSPPTAVTGTTASPRKKVVAIPRATRPTPAGLAGLGAGGGRGAEHQTSRADAQVPGAIAATPESVPQSKNPAFTSTIDGVAPVEVSGPTIPVASSWMRPVAEGQSKPDAGDSGAITFTSVAAGTP